MKVYIKNGIVLLFKWKMVNQFREEKKNSKVYGKSLV